MNDSVNKNTYGSLNLRIKKVLEDIIDVAYRDEDEETRRRYKGFQFYVVNKEVKSTSGMYHYDGHKIEVYNPRLGIRHMSKCAIHELSHHIDLCKNGISGHQKPFYEEYTKLMYASLDMGILTQEDFYDDWSSDRNKVRRIADAYVPHPVEYNSEQQTIKVLKGFSVKDELKSQGYKWNGLEQVWEKPVETLEEDMAYLKSIGVPRLTEDSGEFNSGPSYRIDVNGLYVESVVYVTVSGYTYPIKEILKQYGFFYQKEPGRWAAKGTAEEMNALLKRIEQDEALESYKFSILARK